MAKKAEPSGHLTTYLESSTEAGRQLHRYHYLPALVILVVFVIIGTLLLLWLA